MTMVSWELIERRIYLIRGKKVMVDQDLAYLYGVETRTLNQAVKRNLERFPEDFMFQLNKEEADLWFNSRSQNVILKQGENIKYQPFAFTEQGVSMLSSVLKSKTAIKVNIQIMRTFTRLKELIVTNELIRLKIDELEKKYAEHDKKFEAIFEAIRQLLIVPKKPKREIGFHVNPD